MARSGPVVLTILDGWGYRAETNGNAIALARKPTYDRLLREYPNTLIRASEHFVGLPDGQMGNSEVGHLNLGAGRVVRMDITRIDAAITSGEFFKDPTLLKAMQAGAREGHALHLIGLVSRWRCSFAAAASACAAQDGGNQQGLDRVFVHAFMDGRDTMPTSGAGYLEELQQKFDEYGVGKLASVSGRYFAMDRDLRWEHERKAFDAMVTGSGRGRSVCDPLRASTRAITTGSRTSSSSRSSASMRTGEPVATINDDDAVICFNYRADRVRQITRVLTRNSGLATDRRPVVAEGGGTGRGDSAERTSDAICTTSCMTQYDKKFALPMVIPPESMDNLLANVMAKYDLRNLRVAETEKYAHVTYFFNGGIEKPFAGEDRELVPSQKVATYDLAPEMSAEGIADIVERSVTDTAFDVVIVNFANADMVGHSGKIEPTVKAVETIDAQLGRIYQRSARSNMRAGLSPRTTAMRRC